MIDDEEIIATHGFLVFELQAIPQAAIALEAAARRFDHYCQSDPAVGGGFTIRTGMRPERLADMTRAYVYSSEFTDARFGSGKLDCAINWGPDHVWNMLMADERDFKVKGPWNNNPRWGRGNVTDTVFDLRDSIPGEWLAGVARAFATAMDVSFLGAHDKYPLAFTMKDHDPRDYAWPAVVIGPDRFDAVPESRILGAPAHRVDKLPNGGYWLQTRENPFDATDAEVKELATWLGLKTPPPRNRHRPKRIRDDLEKF